MAGPSALAGLMAVPVNCDPAKHHHHSLCHSTSLHATDGCAADAAHASICEVCAGSRQAADRLLNMLAAAPRAA